MHGDRYNIFKYVVIPPPIGVRATQSSSSAPVEISWSPPTYHGPFEITGYRIFYGSRQNNNISVSIGATSIGIGVNESYDYQAVFIHSESNQLYYSELVVVNVTVGKLIAIEFSLCI
jgi:aspartate ammonia-lyase